MLEFPKSLEKRRGVPETPVPLSADRRWSIADRAAWALAIAPGVRLRKGADGSRLSLALRRAISLAAMVISSII